jgi:tRNA wybutosine-synthesizing protein 1
VIRFTLVRSFNYHDEALKAWAKMVEVAQPTYVEVKSYMHVGASRARLSRSDMLRHVEVLKFAKKLADLTGYQMLSHQVESRVVLLSRLDEPKRVGSGCRDEWRRDREEIEEILRSLRNVSEDEVEYRLIMRNRI